jgi:hypothetical protein
MHFDKKIGYLYHGRFNNKRIRGRFFKKGFRAYRKKLRLANVGA